MSEQSLLPLISRWWWLLALGAVLGALGGFIAASILPKDYESKVDMLVGPVNTDTGLDASGSLAATYQNLATSRPVLADALKTTGNSMSVTDFTKNVTATSNTVTRVVSVTVKDGDAKAASALANAIGTRLSKITNELPAAATAQFDAFNGEPEVQQLDFDTRRAVNRALRRVFGSTTAGQLTVINGAVPAESAASPKPKLLAVLGLLAGLLVAALLAVILETRQANRRAEELSSWEAVA
jgi:capsular polysaccharide biosynthesis protein